MMQRQVWVCMACFVRYEQPLGALLAPIDSVGKPSDILISLLEQLRSVCDPRIRN
jgi:hypothetical protein